MDFSMYFTQLSVGCLGLAPLVPWRSVGKGYYVMMLCIGLGLLPVGWFFRASSAGPGFPAFGTDSDGVVNLLLAAYGVAGALALLAFWYGTGAAGHRLTLLAAGLGWAAVAADGVRMATLPHQPPLSPAASGPLLAVNYAAGALLLGSVLSAMLLGHWYLVVKDLPVAPLKTLTFLLFGSLALRAAATAAAFLLDSPGGSRVVDRSFLFVLVYGLFSLGTPMAMSWMVWGTVKIRSTQAATGILYGVTAFILMGEAAARFVLLRTGFPL